ncbi:MAG: tetratricopeptide repeat protein [Rhizobiaceae bacterium]|nr:tetratricopeptide repeat protein [Rhizobiaceae bacterium]
MPAAPTYQPPGPVADDTVVKDVTNESFMSDVIEASRSNPVVVDFWAPWCGPCKQLGPIIEKVAAETKGVALCKMDIEQYPEISNQMGIQSIPAVVAFVDGRPADAFMGAKPEGEVRRFFEKIAGKVKPDAEAQDMAAAMEQANQLMVDGDHGTAAEVFSAILAREPGNIDAFAGMGQCYIAVGEIDMAQMLVDKIPEEHRDKGPLIALIKSIELARQASDLGGLAELAAAVEANPNDHQARLDYAVALNAEGEREAATEQLITIVRADRTWQDDGARTQLLEFFEAWGNMDPATVSGRRALSSILFS